MNTIAELADKLASITSLLELDGFTKALDAQGELHETARQMIATRKAEIERTELIRAGRK